MLHVVTRRSYIAHGQDCRLVELALEGQVIVLGHRVLFLL